MELSELSLILGHVNLTSCVVAVAEEKMAVDTDIARTVGLGWLLGVECVTTGALVLNVGSSDRTAGLCGNSVAGLREAISGAVGDSAVVGGAVGRPSACLHT